MSRFRSFAIRYQFLLISASVLAGAAALRLLFFVGLSCADDNVFLTAAKKVFDADAIPYLGDSVFEMRWSLVYPIALSSKVFGLSEISVVLWPMLCALLEIAVVLVIGTKVHSRTCGIVSALLLLCFPPHILGSTRPLPDSIIAGMQALGLLVFIWSEDRKVGALPLWLNTLCGVLLGIGYLARATAAFVFLPLVVYIFAVSLKERRLRLLYLMPFIGFGSVLVLEGAVHLWNGRPFLNRFVEISYVYTALSHGRGDYLTFPKYLWHDSPVEMPMGLSRFFLLGGLLYSFFLARTSRSWFLISMVCWGLLLYWQFGVQSLTSFEPINKEFRYLAVVFGPLSLLTGALLVDLKKGLELGKIAAFSRNQGGNLVLVTLILVYFFSAIAHTSESQATWNKSAPPCGGCKLAAYEVMEVLRSTVDVNQVVVPAGPTSALLGVLALADAGLDKNLVELLRQEDLPPNFPDLPFPYLYLLRPTNRPPVLGA